MVHGSGPSDVRSWRSDLGYHTIFLRAGVAVMAWDKPGCGRSSGTFDGNQLWRKRADEVIAGLAAARAHPAIDRTRVGCFGISQGGWVVPMAIVRDPAIAFAVLLSGPAHGGLSQGRYLVRKHLLHAGETPAYAERGESGRLATPRPWRGSGAAPAAVAASLGALLAHPVAGAFLRWVGEESALRQRLGIHPNQAVDAGDLLAHVHCPVFAGGFGELDAQVDWRESVGAYRSAAAATRQCRDDGPQLSWCRPWSPAIRDRIHARSRSPVERGPSGDRSRIRRGSHRLARRARIYRS